MELLRIWPYLTPPSICLDERGYKMSIFAYFQVCKLFLVVYSLGMESALHPSPLPLLLLGAVAVVFLLGIPGRYYKKSPKRYDRLRKCADDIWVLSNPPPFHIYGKTMVVYRLEEGNVALFNPLNYSETLETMINSIGKIKYIVLISGRDDRILKSWIGSKNKPLLYTTEKSFKGRISSIYKKNDYPIFPITHPSFEENNKNNSVRLIKLPNFPKQNTFVSIISKDGKKVLLTTESFIEATNTIGKLPFFVKTGFKIKGPLSRKKRISMVKDLASLESHNILIPGRGIGIYNKYSVEQYLNDGCNKMLNLGDKDVPRWSGIQRVIKI